MCKAQEKIESNYGEMKEKKWVWIKGPYTVYGKKSFLSKESDTTTLQRIYFAYYVGIISSYSNRIKGPFVAVTKLTLSPAGCALTIQRFQQCLSSVVDTGAYRTQQAP